MAGADDFERLTERQKQCLRLVNRLYETKDIAAELGIAPGRVNKIIAEAMLILGTTRRTAAARILAQREAISVDTKGGHPFTGQPMSLHQFEIPRSDRPVVETSESQRDGTDEPLENKRFREAAHALRLSIPLPFPTDGRPRNDLKAMSLMLSVAIIATASLIAAGAAVSLLFAFNHWIHG